ncbi:zinc finger protein 257-like isoform X1 [Schistocerca cancellata]|uniref:zinc finger protein 257-like isoform X1 n=1 Tax=Schistocerca cancellata TaxID=274614 RepID=UPI0021196DD2|nr:zinc finger protein 257-like isoform X1 [Schistocerca cancellata]
MELVKCRLCTSNENLIEIFSEDGHARRLALKINECLPVVVHPGDRLPKLICVSCSNKVEEFYNFWRACEEANLTLDSVCNLQEDPNLQSEQSLRVSHPAVIEGSDAKTDKDNEDQLCVPVEPNDVMQELCARAESPVEPTFNIKEPRIGDYVLVKEETFELAKDKHCKGSNSNEEKINLEFSEHEAETDKDIFEVQQKRKEKLPQMWDVFEKHGSNSMVTHRRYIISKAAFSCSLCGQCYKLAEALSGDTTDNNGAGVEFRTFACSICGKVFPRRSSLKRHLSLHGDVKPFPCHLCGRAFNRKEHLSRHTLSHTGGRPYNCDICSKPFTRKEHLARHRNITHFSELHPNKIFVTAGSSTENIKKESEDSRIDQPYKCNFCGQCFSEDEHLIKHQENEHWQVTASSMKETILRPYICTVCHKRFTRKEHLVRHHKIHEKHYTSVQRTDLSVSLMKNRTFCIDMQGMEIRGSSSCPLPKVASIDTEDI